MLVATLGAPGISSPLAAFLRGTGGGVVHSTTATQKAGSDDDDVLAIEATASAQKQEQKQEHALGLSLAWLLVNRPAGAHCSLRLGGEDGAGAQPIVLHARASAAAAAASPPAVPAACVEVYHLHCHFNGRPGSEAAARALLATVGESLRGAGERALHDHVWHEKNGPHDPWSWELWVEGERALGVAAAALMRWRRPAEAAALGLYVCLHADTDQELTDHASRLAWVGPTDPQELDLPFFAPPPPTYRGPAAHRRRSDGAALFSMGERWAREEPGGAVRRDGYGAVDRGAAAAAAAAAAAVLPSMFLPHGSPPIPIEPCASGDWLASAAATLPCRPRAIVFMSPHFRTSGTFTVGTHPRPPTMMDFDDDTSEAAVAQLRRLRYPCRGSPALGRRVAQLLRAGGLPCDEQPTRGLDHGVWTPLYLMFPDADVEVVVLSVRKDLDAAAHMAAGRALAPLRREGVLLVGSGEAVHNVPEMGARDSPRQPWCTAFEGWLERTMLPPHAPKSDEERDAALAGWRRNGPCAERAHPAGSSPGEHLIPLLFAYGAAGEARGSGRCVHKEYLGSLPMAAYEFGRAAAPSSARL